MTYSRANSMTYGFALVYGVHPLRALQMTSVDHTTARASVLRFLTRSAQFAAEPEKKESAQGVKDT